VRVLEEAFRQGLAGKGSAIKRDPVVHRQLASIGKMLCLIMFSFRSGRESGDTMEEVESIRKKQVNKEFDRWESIQHFIFSDPYRLLTELQHMVRYQVT
jgi:hypothetical protein